MNTKSTPTLLVIISLLLVCAASLAGQAPGDITGIIHSAERPAIAVADMRGTGDAQRNMDIFNSTLWDELSNAGILKMVAKSVYPLEVPQRPQDFKPPAVPANARRGTPPTRNGPWLTDWCGPPVSANYLAFGYTAVQGNQLVLFGWFYDVSQPTTQAAQVLGKLYFGSLDEAGAVKVARDFAADILKQF